MRASYLSFHAQMRFDQFVAAEFVARLLFLGEHEPLDHRLRGDTGVVGARHPQGVVRPCIRRHRMSTSWSVLLSACPMCSAPVTFGGGMTMVNGFFAASGSLWK